VPGEELELEIAIKSRLGRITADLKRTAQRIGSQSCRLQHDMRRWWRACRRFTAIHLTEF
jgi:hypothetical protein